MGSVALKQSQGFTLLEVILAMALLALGLTIAIASLQSLRGAVAHGERQSVVEDQQIAVTRRLRDLVQHAQPIPRSTEPGAGVLAGDGNRLGWITELRGNVPGEGGLYWAALVQAPAAHGNTLAICLQRWRPGASVPPCTQGEPLVEHLAGLELVYRGLKPERIAGPDQSRWSQPVLPLQVEIRIRDQRSAWEPIVVWIPQAQPG